MPGPPHRPFITFSRWILAFFLLSLDLSEDPASVASLCKSTHMCVAVSHDPGLPNATEAGFVLILILGKETGVAHSLEWVHFGWVLPHPTGSTLILLSAQSTQIFETVKKNQSQWNLLLNFDIFLVIIFDKFFWRRHSKPQITNQLSWAINLFKV